MITIDDLERVAAIMKQIPAEIWMANIDLHPEAHRWLRDTAETSILTGASVAGIGMTRFQLGYELGYERAKALYQDPLRG